MWTSAIENEWTGWIVENVIIDGSVRLRSNVHHWTRTRK